MASFPAAFSNMDANKMWEVRYLSGAAYAALQNEHKKEARAWEQKNLLPKGSVILAPRQFKPKPKKKKA